MSSHHPDALHATTTITQSPFHDQSQSPLFRRLPLDIRRQIYFQLWLDCGLTQHIYTFGRSSYLQSYPCILDDSEWDRDPRPHAEESTAAPDPDPQFPEGQLPADEEEEEEQQQQQQPEFYDDPGDIDAAIQDITPGPDGPLDDEQPDTPWCQHKPCFERWIQKWDRSYERAYSANYRGISSQLGIRSRGERAGERLRASLMLAPLLVCRRMGLEAGESLFSSVRFSFTLEGLGRFLGEVPRDLTRRVRFVDVVICSLLFFEMPPPLDKRVQTVCETLEDAFPKLRGQSVYNCGESEAMLSSKAYVQQQQELCHVRLTYLSELRLTLHPTRLRTPIPPAEAFTPFYKLAKGLENLHRFDMRLPCKCEEDCLVGYGDTPEYLHDAPFKAVLVPQGWHDTGHCDPFIST